MRLTREPDRTKTAIERLKVISARLYWCPRCNVPLLESQCGLCGGDALSVHITPPGDARPAFTGDLKRLRGALAEYFRDKYAVEKFLPRRKLVLLNKIQYPDAADEVIVDGQIVGHLFYDLFERKWRFKPLYAGVAQIVEEELAPFAIVSLPKITRNYVIKRSKITKEEVIWEKGRFVAIELESKTMQGVAEVVRGKRLRVIKAWPWKRRLKLKGEPTWADVVRANSRRLDKLEKEAIEFIRDLVEKYKLPVFVSFSGGKDSLVTFRLAEKALGYKPDILFNDTGLELPETVRYVREFARREGVRLLVASAGDAFWRGLQVLGPPARDYRWCCKVAKLIPIARAVRRAYPHGALSLVGQRKYESALRAVSPRIWRNIWIPGTVSASPIHDWTALDVWLYILREKLLVNPLYYMGFDRLGCWLCPASEIAELETVREIHPELWSKWEGYLFDYADKRGYPREWVVLGLWRWLKLPGDIVRVAKRLRVNLDYREKRSLIVDVSRRDSHIIATVSGIEELEKRVSSLVHILGAVNVRVKGENVIFEGDVSEQQVRVLIMRAAYCVQCGACELRCPTGAIKVGKYPVVDPEKCTRCRLCNLACPIAVFSAKTEPS